MLEEKFPCNYCGSCPLWLAFDAEEIKTYDKLLEMCVRQKCKLVDKIIDEDK